MKIDFAFSREIEQLWGGYEIMQILPRRYAKCHNKFIKFNCSVFIFVKNVENETCKECWVALWEKLSFIASINQNRNVPKQRDQTKTKTSGEFCATGYFRILRSYHIPFKIAHCSKKFKITNFRLNQFLIYKIVKDLMKLYSPYLVPSI